MYCQIIKVLMTFSFWFGKRYRWDEFCLFFCFSWWICVMGLTLFVHVNENMEGLEWNCGSGISFWLFAQVDVGVGQARKNCGMGLRGGCVGDLQNFGLRILVWHRILQKIYLTLYVYYLTLLTCKIKLFMMQYFLCTMFYISCFYVWSICKRCEFKCMWIFVLFSSQKRIYKTLVTRN